MTFLTVTNMSAKDVKFRVTEKKTGYSAIVSLADLYGYEGLIDGCGICIQYGKGHIDQRLQGKMISFNSGYAYRGMNPEYEIEPVYPDNYKVKE